VEPTSTKIQTTGSTAHTKLDFVKKSKICLTLLITPADAKVMTSCRSADALVNVEPGQVSARENWESTDALVNGDAALIIKNKRNGDAGISRCIL